MKIGDKKGQAFLIISVLLLGILVAFVTIQNYSRQPDFSNVFEIASDIQIESEYVVDYALTSGDSLAVQDFSYSVSNAFADKDFYFITDFILGNNVECFYWDSGSKMPCANFSVIPPEGPIQFVLDDTPYYFDLHKGKHFYFMIVDSKGGNKYVYTNQVK